MQPPLQRPGGPAIVGPFPIPIEAVGLEWFIWVNKVTAAESMRIVQAILANYTAKPDAEQRPLLTAQRTTPIANWNVLLTDPAAEEAVLARRCHFPE